MTARTRCARAAESAEAAAVLRTCCCSGSAERARSPAYAKEGIVFTKIATVIAYQADGTGEKTMEVAARVQSENGVHQAELLDFGTISTRP